MDNFKALIKRLFCLSIKDLKRMEHDAVCRTAFIIESVKVKVASKSQRKFAIVTVSDGEMAVEIPVWPELFDEKSFLLTNNQLLFAIVQIDRKDKGFRLQCHWLDDLTTMDEVKIKKSDEVYDQIKNLVVRRKTMIRQDKSPSKLSSVSRMKKCKLRINADEVKFSHILKIKKILKNYSGPIRVEMEFVSRSQKTSSLTLSPAYGVSQSQDLKKDLKAVDGLCDLKFI
jgi:DNA polymerase-3 subunit alpha